MLLQRLRGLDWRYSLTEVVLIFVGISLALLFDNWNEEQKERALETELLGALRSDLIETKANLWRPTHSTETALDSQKKLLESLESGGQPPSSQQLYEVFFNDSTLSEASGAYESLKNVGLDLVSDRDLRKLITHHYESELDSLGEQEDMLRQRLLLVAFPYFMDNFAPQEASGLVWREYNYGQVPAYDNLGPINWEQLRQDPKFKLLMIDLYERRQSLLWSYGIFESEIDTLLALLPKADQI